MTEKTFFDGAIMAYEDCHAFALKLAQELPEQVKFCEPVFLELAKGFKNKADNVQFLISSDMGMQ